MRLRRVSGKELVKILQKRGWQIKRITGSHRILVRQVGPSKTLKVSVPVHGDKTMNIDTQKSVMREAGLKNEDLQE